VYSFSFKGSRYRRLGGLGHPQAAWRAGSTLPGNNIRPPWWGWCPFCLLFVFACAGVSVCAWGAGGFCSGLLCGVSCVCCAFVRVLLCSCGHRLWSVLCRKPLPPHVKIPLSQNSAGGSLVDMDGYLKEVSINPYVFIRLVAQAFPNKTGTAQGSMTFVGAGWLRLYRGLIPLPSLRETRR